MDYLNIRTPARAGFDFGEELIKFFDDLAKLRKTNFCLYAIIQLNIFLIFYTVVSLYHSLIKRVWPSSEVHEPEPEPQPESEPEPQDPVTGYYTPVESDSEDEPEPTKSEYDSEYSSEYDSEYDSSDEYDYNNQIPIETARRKTANLSHALVQKYKHDPTITTVNAHVIGPKSQTLDMFSTGTLHSVGLDIIFNQPTLTIRPGKSVWVSLGVSVILESNKYWFTVVLRSHVLKHGIVMGNFPIIDPDYADNVSIRLTNTSNTSVNIYRGSSFCQVVAFERINLVGISHSVVTEEQLDIENSSRGGFGSTGKTING